MKKYVVLLFAAIWSLAAPLSAQTVLGFHAGVNIANFGGDDVENTDSRTGLNIGASVRFSLAENLGLSLGGGYSQMGTELSEQGVTGKIKLDYLEFPVLLRFAFPSSSNLGLHLYGGAVVGIEAKCEIEGSEGSVSVTADCDEADLDTKSTQFGLMGGAGVDIGISDSMDLFLDVLYNLGLTTVDGSAEEADVKNRAFTIRAGLAIPLG